MTLSNKAPHVFVRDYPFPFAAMLAICSDLDETQSLDAYVEIARFLNTEQRTVYGTGVGLEVGNTIYFDMPPGELSYWSVDDGGRERLRALIRSGHIDCFHSFGDLARRPQAERALADLAKHDCRLAVWVDHAVAPTNFGVDIMQGEGDVEAAEAYHADLTWRFGVRFVWLGRVTSVIGQNVRASMAGVWNRELPVPSAKTVAKELAKRALGTAGSAKYKMNADNALMRPYSLRSGHPVWEFMRSNPHWGGVSCGDTGEGLGDVLRPAVLDTLIAKRGVSVFYTHLGKGRDRSKPLGARTLAGLRLVAELQAAGKLMVTTTSKLLRYCRMRDHVDWSATDEGRLLRLSVTTPLAPSELDGLTFNVPKGKAVELEVNGVRRDVVRFESTGEDCDSVSVPWSRAQFPLD